MTKRFKLLDCVLAVVCVVLTVEAAAPAAAIGPSQYFWWILLLVTFCLPYSLISAELGTTYEGEGGLSDWVSRAFGKGWGSRVAWYYWVNFPLWMASIAVFFTENIPIIFGIESPFWLTMLIRLTFIWAIVGLSLGGAAENKWLFNLGTFFKIIIMAILGLGGIWVAMRQGVATVITPRSLLPGLDLGSLSFISVILFNFMGFEVVTTYVKQMEKPKKQIPQAILVGGVIVTVMYLLASFGISVAIPLEQLSTSSGILDSIHFLLGQPAQWLMIILGCMLLFAMFVNQLSWAFGINFVARYAAQTAGMPRIFALSTKKDAPLGAALMNGLLASLLVVLAPLIPSEEIFWSFFALNLVTLLLSYIPLFPAFLKLRRVDADIERPYHVWGGKTFITCLAIVPMVLLMLAVLFTIMPLSEAEIISKIPLLIGTLLALLSGEIIAYRARKRVYKP